MDNAPRNYGCLQAKEGDIGHLQAGFWYYLSWHHDSTFEGSVFEQQNI